MRLNKIMSIVLAVALVMSFAMSASAGSLYFSYDFPGADTAYETWRSAYPVQIVRDANETILASAYSGQFGSSDATAVAPNFAELRKLGYEAIIGGTYNNTNANTVFATNSNGNNVLDCGSTSTQHDLVFIPDSSWDGSANLNETYVVSYDVAFTDTHALVYSFNLNDVWGYNTTSGKNVEVGLFSVANGATHLNLQKDSQGGGPTFVPTTNTTFRLATGFKYDATKGHLVKAVGLDAENVMVDGTYQLAGVKTVEALNVPIGAKHPVVGKIRMYTIDTTAGFNVTADIDGEERVAVDTGSTTITFSHPVADVTADDAVFTLKKDGATVSTLSAGAITTGTVNGSYVSTVDVDLPALVEDAEYEIVVSGVKNELGEALADGTISFSTPKPDLTFDIDITNATVGAMSEATAAISNNTLDQTKAVSVIYGVYTAAGKLVDVVYANETVAAGKTATISAGIKLASDAAKAKVMVWDGLNAISPVTGFVGVDVAQ